MHRTKLHRHMTVRPREQQVGTSSRSLRAALLQQTIVPHRSHQTGRQTAR